MNEFLKKLKIENIVIFIVLLIIVIIVINNLFASKEAQNIVVQKINDEAQSTYIGDNLEIKLQKILSKISGVGNADVMISYANSSKKVPIYDTKANTTTITEVDANGGKRETKEISNEQSIIYEEKSGIKTPAVEENIMPQIIGVIVVAEGAGSMAIKENIRLAVEAVVDIPAHRIQVFSK